MILSNITTNKPKLTGLKMRLYLQKLKKLIVLFKHLKNSKTKIKNLSQKLNKILYKSKQASKNVKYLTNQNSISYIINIVLSQTNTIVNITDIYGNVKISFSAGIINLTKSQKKAQPMALINIFKTLLLKAKFLNNKAVALHFKNTKPHHESLILKLLKTKLFIKSVQNSNLMPHNGCRPKKIKRIKRRTKRLVLK